MTHNAALRTADAPILRQTRIGRAIQLGMLPDFSIFEIELPIARLPAALDRFRLLHLSDAHFGPAWCDGYDRLLAMIAEQHADVIAFTGDWVENKRDFTPALPTVQRFAGGIDSKSGTLSCLGNHDGRFIAPHLIDAGIRVLVGESVRIRRGEDSVEIIGLPGVARADTTPALLASFGPPQANAVRIVLSHFPDQIRTLASLRPQLVLAGHTHGGQICLPGGWPLMTHDALPRRMSGGLHRVDDTWLHISRGFGCSKWNLRLFAPSEFTVITLRRSPRP